MGRFVLPMAIATMVVIAACSGNDDTPSASGTDPAPTNEAPSGTVASDTGPVDTTAAPSPPEPTEANVTLVEFATGLDSPVAFAARPNSSVAYIAEQYLGVRSVLPDGSLGGLVLDLAGKVTEGTEQGVLGVAFSPDGSKVYVDFTDPDGHTRVVEYTMDGDDIDDASARDVLIVEQPFSNHNGGDVRFGPDGMLYIALGDGGAGGDPQGNGQDLDALLGKILRIDPRATSGAPYSVPNDNPFVGTNGADEVWAWGLRNPWRFSFDQDTGDLWIGDVGQNEYEEIDHAPAGKGGLNFGWNAREGLHDYEGGQRPDGAVDPVFELSHGDGNCAVTGGFVYRGAEIPALVGSYVFADYCKGDLIALDLRGGSAQPVSLDQNVAEVTSFGQDDDGELYVLSRQGTIFKIVLT